MEKGNCMLCGQDMFPPLLDEYKTRKLKMIAIIKSYLVRIFSVDEKNATLMATSLIERVELELIDC